MNNHQITSESIVISKIVFDRTHFEHIINPLSFFILLNELNELNEQTYNQTV